VAKVEEVDSTWKLEPVQKQPMMGWMDELQWWNGGEG
jgi:hypothetical protein